MASDFARKLLIKHERVVSKCYDDGDGLPVVPGKVMKGHPTIGIGRALDTKGLSPMEINNLFENDLVDAEIILGDIFGIEIFKESERRVAALLSMAHNLGRSGLGKFVRMIEAVKKGDWQTAALEATASKWYVQVGSRGVEIVKLLEEA